MRWYPTIRYMVDIWIDVLTSTQEGNFFGLLVHSDTFWLLHGTAIWSRSDSKSDSFKIRDLSNHRTKRSKLEQNDKSHSWWNLLRTNTETHSDIYGKVIILWVTYSHCVSTASKLNNCISARTSNMYAHEYIYILD